MGQAIRFIGMVLGILVSCACTALSARSYLYRDNLKLNTGKNSAVRFMLSCPDRLDLSLYTDCTGKSDILWEPTYRSERPGYVDHETEVMTPYYGLLGVAVVPFQSGGGEYIGLPLSGAAFVFSLPLMLRIRKWIRRGIRPRSPGGWFTVAAALALFAGVGFASLSYRTFWHSDDVRGRYSAFTHRDTLTLLKYPDEPGQPIHFTTDYYERPGSGGVPYPASRVRGSFLGFTVANVGDDVPGALSLWMPLSWMAVGMFLVPLRWLMHCWAARQGRRGFPVYR